MARKHRETHTVELESGGKISFKFNFRSFRLTDRDRELVTHLIDTVHDYEALAAYEIPKEREPKERAAPEEIEAASRGSKTPVGLDR